MNNLYTRALSTILAAVLVLALPFESDAQWSPRRKKRYNCSQQLEKAMQRYGKGRYNEVKTLLTETKYQCTGHSSMDSILYYLGMSLLKSKAPEEAKIEFERLALDFPNSPFAEEALFRRGHCSAVSSNPAIRDQSKTRDAIRELSAFIDRYPHSPFADSAQHHMDICENKLAEKEFRAAEFYEKIDKYEAAIVYYKSLLADYPGSPFSAEAKLGIARSLAKLRRPKEAKPVLDSLIESSTDPEISRKARMLLGRLDELGQKRSLWKWFRAKHEARQQPPNSAPQAETREDDGTQQKPASAQQTDSAAPQQDDQQVRQPAGEDPGESATDEQNQAPSPDGENDESADVPQREGDGEKEAPAQADSPVPPSE